MVSANVKIIEELQSFLNLVTEDHEIRSLFSEKPTDSAKVGVRPLVRAEAIIRERRRLVSDQRQHEKEAIICVH